jgi:hypothetical protein
MLAEEGGLLGMASKKELQSRIDQIDSVLEILQEIRAALVGELEALKES